MNDAPGAGLRALLVTALNSAHKPADEPIGDERHDQHIRYSGCYVCRGDVEKLADALLPVFEGAVASETDQLMDKFRAVMPVGALWRIVLGPRGAPEHWPLAPNTSAFEVAHLLIEARRTWPDAYAESRGVGPWRESDPTGTAPTPKPAHVVAPNVCAGCGSQRIVIRSRRAYCTEPACDRRLPGPPCETCARPRSLHVCLSCSSDEIQPGPGCHNCRGTGWNQTPCLPPAAGPA